MSKSGSKDEHEYVYVMVDSGGNAVKGGVIKTVKPLGSGFDDKDVVKEGDGEDVDAIFDKMPKDYNKSIVNCGSGDKKIDKPNMYCVFLNKGDGKVAALGCGKTGGDNRFVDMYITGDIKKGIQSEPIRLCYGGDVVPSSARDPESVLVSAPVPAPDSNSINTINKTKTFYLQNDATKRLRDNFIKDDCKQRFNVYETGGGGACFYYVVAAALETDDYNIDHEPAMIKVRRKTNEFVGESNYYKEYFKSAWEEDEEQDKEEIKLRKMPEKTKEQIKEIEQKNLDKNIELLLRKGSWAYQHHIFAVASTYNINIVMFAVKEKIDELNSFDLILTKKEENPYIFIFKPASHFQLVSYNGKIKVNYNDLSDIDTCFQTTSFNVHTSLIDQIENTGSVEDFSNPQYQTGNNMHITVNGQLIKEIDRSLPIEDQKKREAEIQKAVGYASIDDSMDVDKATTLVKNRIKQTSILEDYMKQHHSGVAELTEYKSLMQYIPLENYKLEDDKEEEKKKLLEVLKFVKEVKDKVAQKEQQKTGEEPVIIRDSYINSLVEGIIKSSSYLDEINNAKANIDTIFFQNNGGSRRNRRNDRKQKQNRKQNQRTRKRKTSLT